MPTSGDTATPCPPRRQALESVLPEALLAQGHLAYCEHVETEGDIGLEVLAPEELRPNSDRHEPPDDVPGGSTHGPQHLLEGRPRGGRQYTNAMFAYTQPTKLHSSRLPKALLQHRTGF